MNRTRQAVGLGVLVTVCFGAAAAGGAATYPRIEGWYAALAKPSWTPPDRVFGPVWTVLYLGMAVAAWLVWRQKGLNGARGALTLFAVQLGLNVAWSWLFFGLRSPGLGFMDVLLLGIAVTATLVAFRRRSVAAGLLLVPYLAWVAFAAALNYSIWQMNDELPGATAVSSSGDSPLKNPASKDDEFRRLVAQRLTFNMEWSLAGGRLKKHSLGGEPAAQVNMILKTMGDTVDEPILELTEDRLLLLDQDGVTKYDWRRVR